MDAVHTNGFGSLSSAVRSTVALSATLPLSEDTLALAHRKMSAGPMPQCGLLRAPCYRKLLRRRQQACISRATETPPHIPGLVSKNTGPVLFQERFLLLGKARPRTIFVEVNTVIADEQQTHSNMSVPTKGLRTCAPY